MNQPNQIPEIIKKTSQEIKKIYGDRLDRIILFGSQARGDARPDSDIDVMIVLKNNFNYFQESQRISEPIADLCLEYNVLISCAFATREQFQQRNTGFFRNIRREGVAL